MNHCINCGNNIPDEVKTCGEAGYGDCRKKADPMPKDYQEIEEISINITSHLAGVLPSGLYDRLENDIIKALTTYGNARELQGVEKVEKGVPEKSELKFNRNVPGYDEANAEQDGWNDCRQATLDHTAKVKSELK
jgi:hypothetical protein